MILIDIDSVAALIVVKQLWPQKEFVPERLGDPGGSGPRSSTSQEKGAGLAVQHFLSCEQHLEQLL